MLKSLIVFILAFSMFNLIFSKLQIRDRIYKKSIEINYYNFILILIFLIFMYALELGRDYLINIYGKNSIYLPIYAGVLGSIYINFVPYLFGKKSK